MTNLKTLKDLKYGANINGIELIKITDFKQTLIDIYNKIELGEWPYEYVWINGDKTVGISREFIEWFLGMTRKELEETKQ